MLLLVAESNVGMLRTPWKNTLEHDASLKNYEEYRSLSAAFSIIFVENYNHNH